MSKFTKKLFNIDDLENLTEKDLKTKFRYLFQGTCTVTTNVFSQTLKGVQSETQWNKLFDKEYYKNV